MTRILAPAIALFACAIVLPLALPSGSPTLADEDCLTLADQPPALRADLIPTFERCSTLYPSDAELTADLGAEYEAAGRLDDAEAAYRRGVTVDPEYADLRLRLARLLIRRRAFAEARAEAEAAMRVQPNRRALVDLLREAGEAHGGARP